MLVATPSLVFDVVTCVNQRNYQHLPEIRDYLVAKGVKQWRLFSIFPVGRAAHEPDMQLSNEQFRGMLDFIRDCRLRHACHLLTSTDQRTADIAAASGFTRQTTFYHDFKARYSITPTEYREQNKA
jgi:AraC-like DNA-binding protein